MAETADYDSGASAGAHKVSHQDGGSDEINVLDLSGELADDQKSAWAKVSGKPTTFDPTAHKADHQDGGGDEVNVLDLSGELADEQKSAWAKVSGKPATFDPTAHKTDHQDGGGDEINVGALSGELADPQIPIGWKKIVDVALSNANDYTVSGLDGDVDKIYQIIISGVISVSSSDKLVGVRPNADSTTANYKRGVQHIAQRETGITFNHLVGWWGGTEAILPLGRNGWAYDGPFSAVAILNALSGKERVMTSNFSWNRDSVDDTLVIGSAYNSWKNTADNITSLVFHFDGMDNFTLGRLTIFALRG